MGNEKDNEELNKEQQIQNNKDKVNDDELENIAGGQIGIPRANGFLETRTPGKNLIMGVTDKNRLDI